MAEQDCFNVVSVKKKKKVLWNIHAFFFTCHKEVGGTSGVIVKIEEQYLPTLIISGETM